MAAPILPNPVGEEEVWGVYRAELGQEGGRYRHFDVPCGSHAVLIMDVPEDTE